MAIHPTAIIDDKAQVDPSCEIGPYVVIGPEVVLGGHNRIDAHSVLEGPLEIGENNHIYPGCLLGLDPQSAGYKGERSFVKIGNNNILREMVQVHRSIYEGGETRMGNDNFIMGNSHIAHDCLVGNNTIMANHATLAGHVEIEDRVFISGFVGITQFNRVGAGSILSVHARIVKDIPPYVISVGEKGALAGLNVVGLRRAGIDAEGRKQIKAAYKLYFRSGLSIKQAHVRAENELDMANEYVAHFVNFIKNSKNGVPKATSEEEGKGVGG